MPLLDFFPDDDYHEEGRSFLIMWLCRITDSLNQQLPDRRFIPYLRVRTWLKTEEQVASFEYGPPSIFDDDGRDTGSRYESDSPPNPILTIPWNFFDDLSLQIVDLSEGHDVCGVIRMVCRGNKASNEAELAFAIECASFLRRGIGLVVIDIIPRRRAVWADHLGHLLQCASRFAPVAKGTEMHVSVFRPARRNQQSEMDVWHYPLSFGDSLPKVSLGIKGAMFLSVDLATTYAKTISETRYVRS